MRRTGLNPGCVRNCGDCNECLSALPYGASCAGSCRHVERCKAMFGQKGHEGACQFVPSRFEPREQLSVATVQMLNEDDSIYGVGSPV